MKYLVVNCGYKNSVQSIINSADTADVAFVHDIFVTKPATNHKPNQKESFWLMPKLCEARCGNIDGVVPDGSAWPPQLKVSDCPDNVLKILKKVIPGGIDFGIVCFKFDNWEIKRFIYEFYI